MDKRIRIVFDRQKAASDVTRGVVEVIETLKGRRGYVNTRVKLFEFQSTTKTTEPLMLPSKGLQEIAKEC